MKELRTIAVNGDIVTCTFGHPLFLVLEPVQKPGPLMAQCFEAIDPRVEQPAKWTIINPRCHCGREWANMLGHVVTAIHFEEGYRS